MGEYTMPAEARARVTKLKPQYPDYLDDPDGLERFRQVVRTTQGHDMAVVNHNSLGRLIDTIDRLRRERDAARAPSTDARARRQAEERELDRRSLDAALDAEWATDAGGDVPAVGQTYTLREALEQFGANLSTREIENAMWTALKAAMNPRAGNEWEITYDREGPR